MASAENLDELIQMRDEGLRCLEVARGHDEESAQTKWQHCISRIEAMITRRQADDFA